jgi:ribosomal-protein-alanine N-acetyltransferase
MNIHVETERFLLRDIEEFDVQGIYDLDSDPEVHEFLGKKPIKTMEEAEKVNAYIRGQYSSNGIGRWAIEDKSTGDFIGWSGLKYEEEVRDYEYYDIGYRIQ